MERHNLEEGKGRAERPLTVSNISITLTPPYQIFHRWRKGILPLGPAQTLVCLPPALLPPPPLLLLAEAVRAPAAGELRRFRAMSFGAMTAGDGILPALPSRTRAPCGIGVV